MAKTLKMNFADRMGDALFVALLRVGFKIGSMSLLTVRGRKSGLPRTTPVTMVERQGKSYLFAPYGAVDWVRNLRAAGGGTLQHGRYTKSFTMVELTPQEAAPIMQEDFATVPAAVRQFFDVTPSSSLEDFEHEAERHPVFQVTIVSE